MGAGLIAGTISGILPGIHSNTIAQIFDSITLNPVLMGVAIVAASSVYTIISFLPSIFLCVPESSTILSVLPGQKMLREGKGLYAVYISSFSALIALIISIILLPLFFVLIPTTYLIIRSFMAFLLALICLVLLLQEKRIDSIAKAAFIFLLSGAFGFVILSSSNLALHEPLFAVFIGMFSFSNLIMTAKNIKIPKQRPAEPMSISQFLPIILVGVLLGSVADIFPAIGSSAQMATFGSILTGADPGKFLSLTMSVGVSHIFSSMISLQTIDKARAGWIAIIRENDALPNINILFLYFAVAVTSIAVAILIMLFLSKYFVIFLASINLKILNIIILLYLLAAILITCGISGLFISIVATAIGILPITLGVRRTHTMGFLLVPTLILLW